MFSKKLEKRIEELERKVMYCYLKKRATGDNDFWFELTEEIPITDVIKLILDKMGLEVKSVPAQPEKYVLGKKGEINGH